MNLTTLREDYQLGMLLEEHADLNPFVQFTNWMNLAIEAKLPEPNAMTLATVSPEGIPSARIVLLKGFSENGFVFFGNYESKKGQHLDANPYAALLFSWLSMQRQIRLEGVVERISAEESTAYFQERPRGSQIGAWASAQSRQIKDARSLEDRYAIYDEEFAGLEVLPRPDFWGGWVLKPTLFEFWQGRSNRLHDRLQYTFEKGEWQRGRLSP